MSVEQLLEAYGIWAVLLCSCFEGEMVIVLAGVAARAELLPWPWVVFVGWTGTFAATQAWFLAGRYAGDRVLMRRPHYQPKVDRAKALLDRWGIWVFVFYRYLYGLRTITPFAIGLSGVSTAKFMLIDGLCWGVWLGALSTLGYIFGETAMGYLEIIYVYQKWFLGLFIVIAIGAIFVRHIRARKRK